MPHPVLITAGATRNPLDAIRYISAASTGRTGVHLAEQLAPHADVTLLASPEAALRAQATGAAIRIEPYGSTRDLLARMEHHVRANPTAVVVHACAVGDYEAEPGAAKIPSGSDELVLRLRPTPKIVDQLRGFSPDIRLVSFKAASPETTDEDLCDIAGRQRDRTASDLVFANVIGRLSQRVLLLGGAPRWFETRGEALAALLDDLRGWTAISPG